MFLRNLCLVIMLVCGVTGVSATDLKEAETTQALTEDDRAEAENVTRVRSQEEKPRPFFNAVSMTQNVQVGLDGWKLNSSTDIPALNRRLFLADSTPQWKYRNPSPWLRYDAQLRLRADALLAMKYRADQSSGARLDELSADWALSPSLGFRAGVLDYKTSWCRTYDLDSPWVRENDPFCTVRTTDLATGAAPGLQTYVNVNAGAYQLQAAAGAFRPMAWGYDREEFTNTVLNDASEVRYNKKWVISMNVTNTDTGSEFRLSHQSTDQGAHYVDGVNAPYLNAQKAKLYYAAAAVYITPKVNFRSTFLKSDLQSDCLSYPGSIGLIDFCDGSIVKGSLTLELAYQATPRDVVVIGYSKYKLTYDYTLFADDGVRRSPGALDLKHRGASLSWRHDWNGGFYAAAQVTWTFLNQKRRSGYLPNPQVPSDARGRSLGVRVGYLF